MPGATVGVVPDVPGARTERWTDPVSADRGPGERTGFAHEVQLQVDFEPGARLSRRPRRSRAPRPRSCPRAAKWRRGTSRCPTAGACASRWWSTAAPSTSTSSATIERRARIVVPDLVPGGQVVEFKPFESEGNPSQLNVAWRNPGTRSDIFHYFGLDAEALEFYS